MKNYLIYIKRAEGFILVHVLFIIALLFLFVTSSIASYQSELFITNRQIEQLQVETLFQMGRVSYLEAMEQSEEMIEEAIFHFPDGSVEITLLEETEEFQRLNFHIVLKNEGGWFSTNHIIKNEQD